MDGLYEQLYHISVFFFNQIINCFCFIIKFVVMCRKTTWLFFIFFSFHDLYNDIYIYMESFLLKRDLQLRTSLHSHLSHKS